MMTCKFLDRCIVQEWCCIPMLLPLPKADMLFLKNKIRSKFCCSYVMQRPPNFFFLSILLHAIFVVTLVVFILYESDALSFSVP